MTGAFGDVSRKYLLRAVDLSGWVTPVTAALPEQIAALIVDQIQFGEIKPGEPIREQQLADRFGVSRGPVRSALRLLVRDRLVVLNDNRGATVRSLSDEDTIAIFHIRAEVSGMILRLAAAAEQKDPTALDAVRQGVELLIEIADSGEDRRALQTHERRQLHQRPPRGLDPSFEVGRQRLSGEDFRATGTRDRCALGSHPEP